jgi:ankyrin repeat protein
MAMPERTSSDRVFALIEAGDVTALRAVLAEDPSAAEARRADGPSALLWACYQGESEALATLLEANPRLDVYEAAALGRTDALRAELDRDPGLAVAFAPDGFTALGLASFFGNRDAVELLLARGARVNDASRNRMRVAPLHSALAGSDSTIAELLVGAGADVNAVQADGYTPLHEAAQNGDQAMAERLVHAGADLQALLDDGSTPADSARKAGHPALAAWLDGLSGEPQAPRSADKPLVRGR